MKKNNYLKNFGHYFSRGKIFLWLSLLFLLDSLVQNLFFHDQKADLFALWSFIFLSLGITFKLFSK